MREATLEEIKELDARGLRNISEKGEAIKQLIRNFAKSGFKVACVDDEINGLYDLNDRSQYKSAYSILRYQSKVREFKDLNIKVKVAHGHFYLIIEED